MRNIKRFFIVMLLVVGLGVCAAVSFFRFCYDKLNFLNDGMTAFLDTKDEGSIAKARMEEILQAINEKDRQVIEDMFSKQALKEASNLEDGINYLFSVFGDEAVISQEKIGGTVDESVNYGKAVKKSGYRFFLYTETRKFWFSIEECLKDSYNEDNIGVYSIQVIDDSIEEAIFDEAGIYFPAGFEG